MPSYTKQRNNAPQKIYEKSIKRKIMISSSRPTARMRKFPRTAPVQRRMPLALQE